MITRPVADYLVQIGLQNDAEVLFAAPDVVLAPAWSGGAEEDGETALEAARAEGRAAGLEAARADFAEEMAQAHAAFASELAEARQKWAQEEGERLCEQLANALSAVEERLAEGVSRILRPFVLDVLRQKMIDKLLENIRAILVNDEKPALRIAGPADLLDILRAHLAAVPAAIDYVPQTGADVTVSAGETSIETQLQAWTDLIGGGD